jgi:predicted aspartyl protease
MPSNQPRRRARANAAHRSGTSASLHLIRTKPLLVIEGRVNGIGPLRFAVDTGASLCILSPAAAKRAALRVPEQQRAQAISAGGRFPTSIAKARLLEIGDLSVRNLEFAVMPLERVNRPTRLRLDGVLGYNLLSRYCVTIDYRNKTLIFH